jgi:peroxiredoxin
MPVLEARNLQAGADLAVAAASAVAATALRAGARAPLFALPDASGRKVALEQLLERGPAVLHFHRGSWCADGRRHLEEFAAVAAQVAALGGRGAAIGPHCAEDGAPDVTPVAAASAHVAAGLLELRDPGMRVARAFGLAFSLPASLRLQYERLGYRPPELDASDGWLVPVPAMYLLDRDGIIVLASVELDYRKRFESASLLGALKAISPDKREYRA